MEAWMDALWFQIVAVVANVKQAADVVLSPLNRVDPLLTVIVLAVATVAIIRYLGRVYTTRRYRELKAEFEKWHGLRMEALRSGDREKGKALARNIDQAGMNRVYYDYFFEGLLKSVVTCHLPLLVVAAYVNEAYNPKVFPEMYGRPHFFLTPGIIGEPVAFSGLFVFVLAVAAVAVIWAVVSRRIHRNTPKPQAKADTADTGGTTHQTLPAESFS
jgi:membrane protein implicated in regulation of membrane protease activity